MVRRVIASLVLLLCAAHVALGDDDPDCLTETGHGEYLMERAADDPDCFGNLYNFFTTFQFPSNDVVMNLCTKECIGEVIEFLQSTEECRESELNQGAVYLLESELCAISDSEDNKDTTCAEILFGTGETSPIGTAVQSCFGWWFLGGTACPALIPQSGATVPCADALKAAQQEYGCCYLNIFDTEEFRNATTRGVVGALEQAGLVVPDDFEIDPTDPKLFDACDVTFPDRCKSLLDSSPTVVVTPVVVLLSALLAKLVT
jgi:hypothetical protein